MRGSAAGLDLPLALACHDTGDQFRHADDGPGHLRFGHGLVGVRAVPDCGKHPGDACLMSYILNEDFTGTAGTLPDSTVWNVCDIGNSPGDFGTGDQEYYTDSTNVIYQDGNSNLIFMVGSKGTDGAGASYWPAGRCDTSNAGSWDSANGATPKAFVQPGQSCEIRVKVSPLAGCWPACWFLGVGNSTGTTTYPADYSEFDLQESGDQNAGGVGYSAETAWGPGSSVQENLSSATSNPGPSFNVGDGNYHVFRLDYYEDELQAFVDGELNYTITQAQVNSAYGAVSGINAAYGGEEWPYANNNGMYVVLNVAVNSSVTGATPSAGALPAEIMAVDYVRIWEPVGPDPNLGDTVTTQVTSFGTPTMVRATSGSVTGSWGSGQSRTAGNQLVALVTAGGSTASAAAISTPSGWTQVAVTSNVATTAYAWVAVYTKTAAGSDSAPAFTATLSGTVAMTVTLFELAAAANLNPVDTYGTYASGGTAGTLTLTATTGGNVSVAGEFAIACFCMERAAATNTWTHGSGWTNAANDGTTNTVLHTAVDYYASPSAGSTLAETGSWATETTAYGAGIILTVVPQLGGIELYQNDASTTISSGGTDAPASGTPEFLTAASWSSFPAASNTTTPPTKFHGADPAAPSELFEVLNTSTGLAVRGAQGTTPVTHSGGFTLQQVIPAGNQQPRWYNVRDPQFGATGNGSTDDTAAFEATWMAVVTSGGTMHIPPGNYKTSYTVGGNVNGMPVAIYADPGATIYYYGSGDCIRMYDSSDYTGWRGSDWRSGIFGFLSIDGSNSSASVASAGVHVGDILGLGVYCSVREFSQHSGSIGVHFDNNYAWTEQLQGRVHVTGNSTNVMFDNSANTSGQATGSFDRMTIDVFINSNGVGDGVTFTNGGATIDSRLGIYGNFGTSVTQYAVLRVSGSNADTASMINYSTLNIGVELDDNTNTAPYTISFGTPEVGYNLIYYCTGIMDFSAYYAFGVSNNAGNFLYFGSVAGDPTLFTMPVLTEAYQQELSGNGQTVYTLLLPISRLTAGTAYTGLILAAGAYSGQTIYVINESGYPLTFAASGTSYVADGASDVLPAGACGLYIWDAGNYLWYRVNQSPYTLAAGTAAQAPLTFTSGTNLTTPAAGSVEYDGVASYATNDTTSGRGLVPVEQKFRLTAAGGTISTIANYFGTTSNISLVSGAEYEIEIVCWFLCTSAGAVTWTFTNSAAPTSMTIDYQMSPAGGLASTPAATDLFGQQWNVTSTAPTVVSPSLSSTFNHRHKFNIRLINGTGTSLKIQATKGTGGTITPGINSSWKARRVPAANVGTFSA